MEEMKLNERFTAYAERMKKVRLLSAPSLDEVKVADEYANLLRLNFKKIGEYAGKNREMLDESLFPLLNEERTLTAEEVAELEEFNRLLLNGEQTTEIDLHLSSLISDYLSKEEEIRLEALKADARGAEETIRFLERRLDVAYARLTHCGRSNPEEWRKRLEEALPYYEKACTFLEKDTFAGLSEEVRVCAVMLAINGTAMYNTRPNATGSENLEWATEQKVRLDKVRKILEDPFYIRLIPEDARHKAILYIISYIAAFSFLDGLSGELYEEACSCALEIERDWEKNPEFVEKALYLSAMREILLYATFRTDSPELFRCLEAVIKLYGERDVKDYSLMGINPNLSFARVLYLVLNGLKKKDPGRLPEHMETILYGIPADMLGYLFRAPKGERLGSYVNILSGFIEYYEELPGGIRMRNFCIHSMAAMHPPTYVHSNMVAKLSICMTRHLLSLKPEIFCGFPKCETVEDVMRNRYKIMDYAWHAALYHDVGKIFMIDTIAMYGRRLLDSEYALLRSHPDKGAEIAVRFESMRDYADVIRGHHRWYDGSRGYPEDFDTARSPYKAIIDIVCVADCLDAATDGVGRSYHEGKRFETFREELEEGAGTRYAPYMVELFADPTADADFRYLLENGRKKTYNETYYLLKDLLQKNI